ncbi:TPA: hypothetical protein HA265_00695 [Candidatus Woesearchaeota archaeon]|nr:hypothetical protein [Candidatus Woesearchaeota archaeon]
MTAQHTASEHAVAQYLAAKTGMDVEEILRLRRISIDDAVNKLLPEDMIDEMKANGEYFFEQDMKFEGEYDRLSYFSSGAVVFMSGSLEKYFEKATEEGKRWYSVNKPCEDVERIVLRFIDRDVTRFVEGVLEGQREAASRLRDCKYR